MELTKKQFEGLKIAISRYQNHEKYTVIAGYAGTGKAQPIDTMIPTPEGNRRLGDIQIGDYVFDRQGKPTKVLGIYPQGVIDNYKITLEDGRTTFCNGEHIWSYYTSKGNLAEKTTSEMLAAGLKYAGKGCFKFKIPNIEHPVKFNISKKLVIDPYVIGAFLGDGCCKESQLTISSSDEELVEEIRQLIGAKQYVKKSDFNYNWTFLLPDEQITTYHNIKNIKFITKKFFNKYQQELCCGAQDKRIPFDYKYASIEDRYSLLQGLLDTDGSIGRNDSNRFNIRYTSTSLNLIKDVQDVLYSLGYKSTISIDSRKEKYTSNCYTLLINIPNEEKYKLFRLSRKKNIALQAKKYIKRKDYSKIAIVNIEKLKEKTDMICIYVDNKEHLYLTNNYIVTHNTTLVHSIIEELPVLEKDVCYAAFTGKAAEVLRKKGNQNAMTLHKLLYDFRRLPNGTFKKIPKTSLEYSLVVVDEVSMVPLSMVLLLLSHKVHVIFLGDPFQIPPILKNEENHLLEKPHIFLDEIMRQSRDSEIIDLSFRIREGKPISYFKGKEVQVLKKNELNTGMLLWADQILCATNKKRKELNYEVRKLLGREKEEPQIGDKIICSKNYWDWNSTLNQDPLINGTIGYIQKLSNSKINIPSFLTSGKILDIPFYNIDLALDQEEKDKFGDSYFDNFKNLQVDQNYLKTEIKNYDSRTEYKISKFLQKKNCSIKDFLYGYAITVHRAQGSEWDKVLVFEEAFPFEKEEHLRWLYTACTRSASRLVLIR
jgi:exodeoxyribonuclease-5